MPNKNHPPIFGKPLRGGLSRTKKNLPNEHRARPPWQHSIQSGLRNVPTEKQRPGNPGEAQNGKATIQRSLVPCAGLTGQAKRKINHHGNEHPSVQDNPSSPYPRPSNPTPKSFVQIQSQVVQCPAVAYWDQCKRAIITEKAQNRWANVSKDNIVKGWKGGEWVHDVETAIWLWHTAFRSPGLLQSSHQTVI